MVESIIAVRRGIAKITLFQENKLIFFYKISCRQGIYLENRHTSYKLFLNRGYSFHNNCSLTSSLDNNWFFVLTEFEPQISYLTANYKLIDQFFSFFYQILRRKKNNNKDSLKIYYK